MERIEAGQGLVEYTIFVEIIIGIVLVMLEVAGQWLTAWLCGILAYFNFVTEACVGI